MHTKVCIGLDIAHFPSLMYGFIMQQFYIYLSRWRRRGVIGFTKLSFALSSLAQPFDKMGRIPEYFSVILSRRKAYAGRFREEPAGKRTGPITKWPPLRLLFTPLEIVFVTLSPFNKRTKVVPKVFQKG